MSCCRGSLDLEKHCLRGEGVSSGVSPFRVSTQRNAVQVLLFTYSPGCPCHFLIEPCIHASLLSLLLFVVLFILRKQ